MEQSAHINFNLISSYFLFFTENEKVWKEYSNILLLTPTILNDYSTYLNF